jgi:anti-anti-sigma factor
MKPPPFDADIRQLSGAATIDLHGEVNAFAESALMQTYNEALEISPASIVLNFNDVNYINSTGIALIVNLLAQARKNHTKLSVYGLSEHYVHIFEITRLVDFMSIFPDEESALENI